MSTSDLERLGADVEGITIHKVTMQDNTLQGSATTSDRKPMPDVLVSIMPREDTEPAVQVLAPSVCSRAESRSLLAVDLAQCGSCNGRDPAVLVVR